MNLSKFGEKFTRKAGITQLMDDLGAAMADGNMLMLGGGNPAHIPEVQNLFRERMMEILSEPKGFETMIGNYDGSRGNQEFVELLAELLRETFGWEITAKNIALTNGSQNAFFCLFNLFAGEMPDGSKKKILFPLTPEYIGYADAGLSDDFFAARKLAAYQTNLSQRRDAAGATGAPFTTSGAQNSRIPPTMCNSPSTRSVAKNRSATMPSRKGERIAAIGPTEYAQPMDSPMFSFNI